MWKLRRLLAHFAQYFDQDADTHPDWFNKQENWHEFSFYLLRKKHFLEDLRETLARWFTRDRAFPGMQGRIRRQAKEIDDLISRAVKHNYLRLISPNTPNAVRGEQYLQITDDGREFIKWMNFAGVCLEKHSPLLTFLFGAGGATALWLVTYFGQRIIRLLVRLFDLHV